MKVKSRALSGLFDARGKIARGTLAVMLAAAACGCSTAISQETTASITREVGYPVPEKKIVRDKKVARQKAPKPVRSAFLGRAPYICTPSGFGSTSRCFLR
ncbi:hypothetical protein [Sinorhizobium arboris]|uniref:hypothetical protein n=1 Tax=Sinorhizobium arboris TaxID=76745 RepID=UPI0004192E00|nr:hypothetical protein [Sinorhizobium arboris]